MAKRMPLSILQRSSCQRTFFKTVDKEIKYFSFIPRHVKAIQTVKGQCTFVRFTRGMMQCSCQQDAGSVTENESDRGRHGRQHVNVWICETGQKLGKDGANQEKLDAVIEKHQGAENVVGLLNKVNKGFVF